jgi:hypothetical protein
MLRSGLLAAGLWLCASATRAAAAPSLDDAQRAEAELRWADARAEVDALVRAGGLGRAQLVRAYELRAEIAAVLDGPDAAEREYRRLLALDPARPPPRRASPVFMTPYQRARRWVGEAGPLRLSHAPPATVPAGVSVELTVQLHDPLALTAAVRAVGEVGGEPFERSPPELPPLGDGVRASYRLEAVDAAGSLLTTLGGDAPFVVRGEAPRLTATVRPPPPSPPPAVAVAAVVAPPPRHARLWRPAVGVGAGALVLAGVAIGLNVAARSEFDSLQHRCAPHCTVGQLSRLHGEEDSSIALYAAAAASAATAIVLLIVDRVRR